MVNRIMGDIQRGTVERKEKDTFLSFHFHINMTMELGHFVWNKGADSYTVVRAILLHSDSIEGWVFP